jgi:hypothetical protein
MYAPCLVSLPYRKALISNLFLQVEHRPVLSKSASWEPERSATQTEAG